MFIKSLKVRLKPTKEQETLMFKSTGVARFAYNWGLNRWNELYDQGQRPSEFDIKKEFNNTIKSQEKYYWLKEVSAQITAKAFSDLNRAFKNFFRGLSEYPKFKSKKKSKKTFYVRYDSIYFKDNKVNIEKIGKVAYVTNYNIPILKVYKNPYCSFDGKYWYLTFGVEFDEKQVELNKDLSIGIDLGIKNLAVVSNLENKIENINKSTTVKKLKKKLKRFQKQLSRKYEANKSEDKFIKTNNIIRLERKIKLIQRRMKNIRMNHIHQSTNLIINLKPYRVVMEQLNVSGMMKNRHLAKAIQEQCFYEFIRVMKYKCNFNKIEFVQVDRFYPSSKKCSRCGNIKNDLRLKDRIYNCEKCNLKIDRDKNASINLSRYDLV